MLREPTEEEKLTINDDAMILLHRHSLPEFITQYANDLFGGVFRKPES